MTYIKTIPPGQADGDLSGIYNDIIRKRGKVADLYIAQSLHPETITDHLNLYMHLMFGRSPLKRYQREMMAVIVSVTNRCEYCIEHHAAALDYFWKDKNKIAALKTDFESVSLPDHDRLLCLLAKTLTLSPDSEETEMIIEKMKTTGMQDRALLDAVLIVSYFNFVNRMILGLGVEKEDDTGGYLYNGISQP